MLYVAPRSLDEAVALLTKNKGAMVLAGGHTLLLEPHRSKLADTLLVDLRYVPNLAGVEPQDGGLRIGALTTLSDIASHPTIRTAYGVLAEVAEATGDPQLRNRATLGGSLATAAPDNEFPGIAVLLAATIEVTGKKTRTLDADDFLSGKATLSSGDIITAVNLPARLPRTGIAYFAHRNAATRSPICSVGVGVALDTEGAITSSRVMLIGGAERPVRLQALEKQLNKATAVAAMSAARTAADGVTMRTDLFASADYRQHLARVLTERALKQALVRAGG